MFSVFFIVVNYMIMYYIDFFVCIKCYIEKFFQMYFFKVCIVLCKYKNVEFLIKLIICILIKYN